MRRSRLKLLFSTAILLFCFAGTVAAEARLGVGGAVELSTDEEIVVRVDLTNHGTEAAVSAAVEGELFGHLEKKSLDEGVPPGATRSVRLRFPLEEASAGVHALLLALEYWASPGPGAAPVVFNQPAYILIAVGENLPPAVRLTVPEAKVASVGRFTIGLESADGAPHRVTLRLQVPRTLRVDPRESTVDVPATGTRSAEMRLFRVDAPWESRQGLLVAATATDGPAARTTAATGVVQVLADPALMPRLRKPFLVTALVLLLLAIAAEVRRRGAPAA